MKYAGAVYMFQRKRLQMNKGSWRFWMRMSDSVRANFFIVLHLPELNVYVVAQRLVEQCAHKWCYSKTTILNSRNPSHVGSSGSLSSDIRDKSTCNTKRPGSDTHTYLSKNEKLGPSDILDLSVHQCTDEQNTTAQHERLGVSVRKTPASK